MRRWVYKDYMAAIEFDADDEIFTGRIVGINDVVGFHASAVKALKKAFHEAVDDYIEACAKVGKRPEKRMSGNLTLRVAPEVHANAAIAAELAGKSLNQWAEEVLDKATEKLGQVKSVKRVSREQQLKAARRLRRTQ